MLVGEQLQYGPASRIFRDEPNRRAHLRGTRGIQDNAGYRAISRFGRCRTSQNQNNDRDPTQGLASRFHKDWLPPSGGVRPRFAYGRGRYSKVRRSGYRLLGQKISRLDFQFVLARRQGFRGDHMLVRNLLAVLLQFFACLDVMGDRLLPLTHLDVQRNIVLVGLLVHFKIVELQVDSHRLVRVEFGIELGTDLGRAEYELPAAY